MLDEVKGQLSECEVKGTEEISKLKRERESLASSLRSELEERESLAKAHREELSEKDVSIKKLEADIVKKKHSLEQARHKEHRLIEQLKVGGYHGNIVAMEKMQLFMCLYVCVLGSVRVE